MRLTPWLIAALALTALGALALAALPARGAPPCGVAGCDCGCAGGGACLRCAAGLSWEPSHGDPDQVILWRLAGGRWTQLGNYHRAADEYNPLLPGDRWGEACEPPLAVPERWRLPRPAKNYGVDWVAAGGGTGWSVSGTPVSEAEARQAIGGPALPDDASKPYVLWVGDEATGQRVRADVGDRARVQSVPPGHWMTYDRTGRVLLYPPGLWFVRPDSTAVSHEAAYAGPDQLAEGLRRCDPNWKPDAVPDLKPAPAPLLPSLPNIDVPPAAAVPGGIVTGGGLVALGLAALRLVRRPA